MTNIPSGVKVDASTNIGIGTETLKVLNIYPDKNIIRVERGIPDIEHAVGTAITFKTKTFFSRSKS